MNLRTYIFKTWQSMFKVFARTEKIAIDFADSKVMAENMTTESFCWLRTEKPNTFVLHNADVNLLQRDSSGRRLLDSGEAKGR